MNDLPTSWARAELGILFESLSNGIASKQNKATAGIPVTRIETISSGKVDPRRIGYVEDLDADEASRYRLQVNDILFSHINSPSHLGKTALYLGRPDPLYHGTNLLLIRSAKAAADDRYLEYGLRFLRSEGVFELNAQKAVNQASINQKKLRALQLPIAPRNEQRRIADKLSAMLAKIDACRLRLDRVPQILKKFREAVLEAAVSGRLTEEWRSLNTEVAAWAECLKTRPPALVGSYERLSKQAFHTVPIDHSAVALPRRWTLCTIADLYHSKVLADFADGNHGSLYPRKEDFGTAGAIFLSAQQIDDRHKVDLAGCPRLRKDKADLLLKGWAMDGDVLLTHNATVGRTALLKGAGEPVLLGTSVTFYRFNADYVDSGFAFVVFASPFFQSQLASVMGQTTRNQVPITKQVSLHFVCPPIEEQREIARRVDVLLALADTLERQYESAAVQVEKLTPSVLAKAFRGELVPQDPNDEPAGEMLARIRQTQAGDAGAAGPRGTPVKGRSARRVKAGGGRRLRASSG